MRVDPFLLREVWVGFKLVDGGLGAGVGDDVS